MKVLIIEDEPAASKRLAKMLTSIDDSISIIAVIESVEDAVNWFRKNEEPDLAMVDIQLSDGRCFDIFSQVDVECPLVFTTAYDEYAVDAFKVNSIDYLLKPIDRKALNNAIKKYHNLKQKFGRENKVKLDALLTRLDIEKPVYKSRFLVKSGQSFQTISTRDIIAFYIESQLGFLITNAGKKIVIDQSLDELETILDPDKFFRINRQMIVAIDAIQSIHQYFNSRLKLNLIIDYQDDVLVSRNKVQNFKKWLDR